MIQFMTPGVSDELFIETLSGVIRISWDTNRRRKRLIIETPDNLVTHKGLDHLKNRLRYLVANEDGTYSPTWKLMVPKVDAKGHILGVRRPESFTVPLSTAKEGSTDAKQPTSHSDLENVAAASHG